MLFKKKKSNAVVMGQAITDEEKAVQTIQKINGMYSSQMGIGDYNSDPIESMTVVETPVFGSQARLLYRNLDLMQRIIDSPVNDALKNGYKITTNFDADLGISDLIAKRSEELKLDDALRQFGIHSRLYSKGGLVYPVVREFDETPLGQNLNWYNLEKIEAINVPYEDHINYFTQNQNAIKANYGNIEHLFLSGALIHSSRYFLHALSFDPFVDRGISILDRVKRAVYGINIANWTVTELLRRYRVLIVSMDPKSSFSQTGEQKKNFLDSLLIIAKAATSKSVIPVPSGQTFEYLQTQLTGLKEGVDTLYDFLSAVSEIPQRKFRGSAGGELAAADADERQYHEMLESKEHKMTLKPAMQFIYRFMLHERRGQIFKKLFEAGIEPDDVEIIIEFNPIASVNPMSEAQINLIKSQTDSTDIASGIISPDMARKARFPEMQDDVIPEPDFDVTQDDYTGTSALDRIDRLKKLVGIK